MPTQDLGNILASVVVTVVAILNVPDQLPKYLGTESPASLPYLTFQLELAIRVYASHSFH
jgi:hypothetical protein